MSIPDTMTAIDVERSQSGVKLVARKIATPRPGPGQILIKVAAGGVNRADLLQVQGHHPPPAGAPATPGLEAAGTVAAVGPDVSGWSVGAAICALLPGGGYAEYALATEPCCLPVPKGVSLVDAGGLPEVVKHTETGFVLPVGDIEGMAARTIEILKDDEHARELGQAGHRRAASLFGAERIVSQYERFYETVLAKG